MAAQKLKSADLAVKFDDKPKARELLNEILKKYPATKAAEAAKAMLEKLDK